MARKGENIFKRKDGRWEARYIKGHNNGRALYGYVFGRTYTEAKEKKSAAIAELSKNTVIRKDTSLSPTMTFVCNGWLDELKLTRKQSTIVKYSNQLSTHILPFFGTMRVNEISNDDVIAFNNSLIIEKKLAPKTVSDILSRIKSVRKYAVIHGYEVKFMPECVTVPQVNSEIRVLSFDEEELLIEYLNGHTSLTNLGILVCLFTGIRIGELCALTWDDISLHKQELHVERTMQRLKTLDDSAEKKTFICIDKPKSKCSIRTIPIPDNIMCALRKAYVSGAYLLTGHPQLFVEPRTMENRFKMILKECGIEDANFHALRHSYATRCIEAGVDIKVLSEMLGHANVNITLNRYVHPTIDFKHENVKRLSELFTVK